MTVVFFGMPATSFDFASFSFQVPICGLAKHTAAATKHNARLIPSVLFLKPPPLNNTLFMSFDSTSIRFIPSF